MILYGTLPSEALPAARALWNEAVPRDSMSEEVFRENVLEDSSVSSSLRVAAFVENDLVGFAIGSATSTVPNIGCLKMIAVRDSYRRRGIGAQLLTRIENELRSDCTGIRVGECPPNYVQPGIDKELPDALGFAKACGFAEFSESVNLTVALEADRLDATTLEKVVIGSGFELRRAGTADLPGLTEFVETEFRPWLDEVNRCFQNDPISVHIGVSPGGDRVVAFAAYDSNNVGTAWFGPMGTAAEYRGNHLGEVLLKRCLADLLRQGLAVATIPWVGPVEFYRRTVGAEQSRSFSRMEKIF